MKKNSLSELFQDPLFLIGLFAKVCSLPFFGSHYLRDLFIPFLDQAILAPTSNPWSLSPPHYFPYGVVLFVILFSPRFLLTKILGGEVLGTTMAGVAIVKLPLLFLDVLLLKTLLDLGGNRKKTLVYFWLNPVLFFITYVHGQLDLAATTFCLISLVCLVRNQIGMSALLMAVATLCKFHVIVVVPLMLAYVWNTRFFPDSIKTIGKWGLLFFVLVGIGMLPIVFANQVAYITVSSPQAMRIFGLQFILADQRVLFVGVAFLVLVMGRLCLSTKITPFGLIFGAGLLFGILVLMTDAGPGWYFWVFPYLALFYSRHVNNQPLIFLLLNVFYFCVFVVEEAGINLGLPGGLLAFTFLQCALLGSLTDMWVSGIRFQMPIFQRVRPLLIGIAGDSGSGKNTMTQCLEKIFGTSNTVFLEGDDYHRWAREKESWKHYTHLDPRANDLPGLTQHASQLVEGLSINHHQYDHKTGRFTEPRDIRPNKALIVQGLHALYQRDLRQKFDLKIFLGPSEAVRLYWKLNRDIKERGAKREDILNSEKKRRKDAILHIDPQKPFADWIVEYFPLEENDVDTLDENKELKMGVRHYFWNDAPVFDLMDALKELGGCTVKRREENSEIDRMIIEISGSPTIEQIHRVANHIFPDLRQLTRSHRPPVWQAGLLGVGQLIALSLIQRKRKPGDDLY